MAVSDTDIEDVVELRPDEKVCPECHYTYSARQPECTATCKSDW